MTDYLEQSSLGEVIVFLQDSSTNLGKTGLVSSDVAVAIKKQGDTVFSAKTVVDASSATADIGSLPDGQVTFSYDTEGTAGNVLTVEVVAVSTPGTPQALPTIVKVGNAITVNLAHDGSAVLNTSVNNATNIAAVGLTGFTLTASGTGAGIITLDEGPTSFAGGIDATFYELGEGFYGVTLSTSNTDTLGKLFTRIVGPTIKAAINGSIVVSTFESPGSTATLTDAPETTVIFGTIFDLSGNPLSNASVQARPLSQPTIVNGAILYSDIVVTKTDTNGFFALTLVEGASVDIFIPATNYRRTFTVPSESTNLFCIA